MSTLLLLGENRNILDFCRREFEREGHRALTATGERELRCILDRENVDLVVSDVEARGADVPSILEEVWDRGVRVIIFTAARDSYSQIPTWLPEACVRNTGRFGPLKEAVDEALAREKAHRAGMFRKLSERRPVEPAEELFGEEVVD